MARPDLVPLDGEITRKWRIRGLIYGGPFHAVMEKFAGCEPDAQKSATINLAPENRLSADVVVPIRDFGVPASDGEMLEAIEAAFTALMLGGSVYAGCGAGQGRTGMFIALLVSVLDTSVDPIAYTRSHYRRLAVETTAQEDYVAGFWKKHGKVRSKLRFRLWWHCITS